MVQPHQRPQPAQPPQSPPAPRLRQPSWLNVRLVAGALLVLVSIVLGTRIVSTADRSVQVWALARDVAAGTTLTAADVRPVRVRLFDTSEEYLLSTKPLEGHTVARAMQAGELVPRAALDPGADGLIISLPVEPQNTPEVARGQLVDVWSTARGCAPVRVLAGVAVQDVRTDRDSALSAGSGAIQVTVRIAAENARGVVAALGGEATVRIVIREGSVATDERADRDGGCADAGQTRGGADAPAAGQR